jgi:hypothetical protein
MRPNHYGALGVFWTLNPSLMTACLLIICLFFIKEWKMCRNAFGFCFCNCLQAGEMVIYCILFSVWRCSGFFKTFFYIFFHLLLNSRNNSYSQGCSSITLETTGRVCFLKKLARVGSRRNVPRNMLESMPHPHKRERRKALYLTSTVLCWSTPPPCFKLYSWENRD